MYVKELCVSFVIVAELIWITVEILTAKAPCTLTSKLHINRTYIVDTENCRIPALEPFDPTILDYYYREKHTNCYNGQPNLIYADNASIYVNVTTLWEHQIDAGHLDCCYISYPKPFPDKKTSYNNTCIHFSYNTTINIEFIIIRCTYRGKLIYQNAFSFIPMKGQLGHKDKMNVILLGLGGMSRLNFHRHMPETVDTMRDLGGIEMFGYNKVSLDGLANIKAVLTGTGEAEPTFSNSTNYIDHLPFIWKDFKQSGYTTCYMEDTYYQSTFDYSSNMFFNQPTDYYWRPCSPLLPMRLNRKSTSNCIFGRRFIDLMLDYFDKFTEAMHQNKKSHFIYFWSETQTHDHLNTAWTIDENISSSINKLKTLGALNNTAIFLLSDHGQRSHGILKTYQGGLEDRLPLLYLYLPQWFREKYPESMKHLQEKAHQLTTPYDVHKTLLNLANLDNALFKQDPAEDVGQSLFALPVFNRSCDSAGVPLEFCSCYVGDHLPNHLQEVVEAAEMVVFKINELLVNTSCAEVSLHKVVRSHRINVPRNCTCDYTMDYVVVLETLPEFGLFEATIQHKLINDEHEYNVTSTIRRNNLNGKFRSCAPEDLQQYCVCKPQA